MIVLFTRTIKYNKIVIEKELEFQCFIILNCCRKEVMLKGILTKQFNFTIEYDEIGTKAPILSLLADNYE